MKQIYQVCIPHTHRDGFDYEAELGVNPCVGARVWVPFRNQTRLGVVTGIKAEPEVSSLKKITAVLDNKPLLVAEMLLLCRWISSYYQSPLSEVVPLALPKKYRQGQDANLPTADFYQLAMPLEAALKLLPSRAHKQRELVEFLALHQQPLSKRHLQSQGFTSSQVLRLLQAHIVHLSQAHSFTEVPALPAPVEITLNAEQTQATAAITRNLHHYQCFLLQGVTGSGKTEVYLKVIAQVLQQGKQVLVLVPEIGLTPQLLARFTERLAQPVAVIHSSLNESERQLAWQLAKENKVQLVIGTRAAVFTPMPSLGLIIIDEEHDASLKQMEGVRYSARDTALMRAHLAHIPIVLGSATPSLESVYNCQQNKYQRLYLTHKALSNTPLQYQLVDLRTQILQHGLAASTLKVIAAHLQKQNQVLLFINRRGFAPVLLCHLCGWMADCRACDSHMTLHRQLGSLLCHHCGRAQKIPQMCASCQSPELLPIGTGTQRVHEFLSHFFPQYQVLRIDRDTVHKKNALNEHLDLIHQGQAQLIVGTQMLAKGHHFPRLSLVVVLDADTGLYNQDFRALEQLGQLLIQVSGRAGRAQEAGQVLIQTHAPDHPLLNVLIRQGYEDFSAALLSQREQAKLPPFHYLAVLRAQSNNLARVTDFLKAAKERLNAFPLTVMGPAPAPLPRKANQYRMQLLIKAPSRKLLQSALTPLREWLTISKLNNGVRWNVDVDPMDLS